MRHLEELGIGGFDPVDGVMREALAADLIDPSSLHTVTFLIESLFRKLGARSRAEDVARGLARRKRSSMHNCARRAPRNCDE